MPRPDARGMVMASLPTEVVLRGLFILTLLCSCHSTAVATWSIVICNHQTQEVGVASVTCLTTFDLRAITPVVRVETGAAAVQAAGDFDGIRRPIIWNALIDGDSPASMLAQLATVAGHQSRQYGIVDTQGRRATFTGVSTFDWAGGVTGVHGDYTYSLQGNILTGPCVVDAMENVILNSTSDLPGILMEAMEAARAAGGDGRCSCSPTLTAATSCGCPPASFTKSGHIGYLIVARAGDTDDNVCTSSGCADGDYFVNLNIPFQTVGALDPVVQLQAQFDDVRSDLIGRPDAIQSQAEFDGAATTMTVTLRDYEGAPITAGSTLTVVHADGSAGRASIGSAADLGGGVFEVLLTASGPGGVDVFEITADDGVRPVVLMPRPSVCIGEPTPDCNLNGIADACDIVDGTSLDVDGNGVPDECESFRRGDCNADGGFDLADAIYALDVLFGGGGAVPCESACDANDDSALDIADPVWILSALFSGGPEPASPFPDCGEDPTPDLLPCTVSAGC